MPGAFGHHCHRHPEGGVGAGRQALDKKLAAGRVGELEGPERRAVGHLEVEGRQGGPVDRTERLVEPLRRVKSKLEIEQMVVRNEKPAETINAMGKPNPVYLATVPEPAEPMTSESQSAAAAPAISRSRLSFKCDFTTFPFSSRT